MSRKHRRNLLIVCMLVAVVTCVFVSSSPAQPGDRPAGPPERPAVRDGQRPPAQVERLERAQRELREQEERLHRRAEELEARERELNRREQDLRVRGAELDIAAQRREMERGAMQPLRQLFALVDDVTEIAADPVASAVMATIALEQHVDGPAQTAEILTDMLPDIRNATVERVVRLRLVDLCARAGQREAAIDHLRELIVSVGPDDDRHDVDEEDDDD